MRLFLRLFKESVLFALNALVVNKLRTFLSLLGVTIGIFAIISVFTMVDSMKSSISDSIASLGENVVFVQKWPWSFGSEYPWWKYIQRPVPSMHELAEIQKRCESAEAACFRFSVNRTVGYGNTSIENVGIVCASHDFDRVRNFELGRGRYFTDNESMSGRAVVILGATIAEGLFGNISPIGKNVKIIGRSFNVVGVFEREGESMIGNTTDDMMLVPVNFARSLIDIKSNRLESSIMVKAKEGVVNAQLIDELTGIMRSIRRLRPKEGDDFALNETSLLANGFEELFGVVNGAGWIIGIFSILVGGFGIANIMFVSVRERTNIIGIQKALGAKNSFILFQFLSEAITLCLIGGLAGLLIILLGTIVLSSVTDFDIVLTFSNVLWGLGISASIGLISGIIPAWSASRLDPVEAIRK